MTKLTVTKQVAKSSGKRNEINRKTILVSLSSTCMLFTSMAFAFTSDSDINDEIVHILSKGSENQITQLFDNGLGINQNIAGDGTPLIIAVQSNNKALVKYLIEHGADVNKESIQDGNPLIAAALTNNLELAEYLVQHGAKLDSIVEHDETALISASRAGHFELVRFLVEQGANVNLAVNTETVRGYELRSPLNGARTEKIRRYLIEHGARS